MTQAVRWGILGGAKFALDHMAPAIRAARGAELRALATASPAKAAEFRACQSDLRIHDSYDALLADPGVEAVYIPLPNTLHVPWAVAALEAGKHVLVEKPAAMSAAELDNLIAARDRTGLLAAEAYMIVHHPQWHHARALLQAGEIGDLAQVEGVFTYDNRDPANIRNRPETGGGALADIGVYPCGAAGWMTGQAPLAVRAEIARENGVDVTANLRARFPGFRLQASVSMRRHARQEMVFHGARGILRLPVPFNPGMRGEARVELHRGLSLVVERFPGVNQYVLQVEAFGRALRTGAPFAWTLENARGTLALLDMARAGEETGALS